VSPSTDTAHEWCAGLPVLRSRVLTGSELRRLQRARRAALAATTAWLLGIPVVLAACVAGVALDAPPGSFASTVGLAGVLLGILAAIPLCVVVANDHHKRARLLSLQSCTPVVLVCEGAARELVGPAAGVASLRRGAGAESDVVLEVLTPSGFVWAVNGRPPAAWIVAPRSRTAGLPPQAPLAARYVKPVETAAGTFRLHRRGLSDEERAELRGYLPRVRLIGVAGALLVNAAAGAQLAALVRAPGAPSVVGVLVVTAALWLDVQVLRLVRARLRLRRDLREGFVVIYQPDPDPEAPYDSVVEFLPHAGAEWTTGGRAAAWRRRHGATDAARPGARVPSAAAGERAASPRP
jgi:hypothetical protein